ncbi:MAG: hypothetical protein V7K46_26590 [Nostoc sp.]
MIRLNSDKTLSWQAQLDGAYFVLPGNHERYRSRHEVDRSHKFGNRSRHEVDRSYKLGNRSRHEVDRYSCNIDNYSLNNVIKT